MSRTVTNPTQPQPQGITGASPARPEEPAKAAPSTEKEDALWEKAENEWGGFTLIRAENVKGNHTVEAVTPRVEREKDGFKMVVCKLIAK